MKQTHYFTVNFTGFTTAASEEQSYLRLIAGEHAFYTDKRHFKDPSLFDRLRLGQPLHIGTCRLKDGSYWIHWLSDGHILLEPSRQPLSIKKLLRPVGLVFFVCLIILACAPWLDIFLLLCFITMLVNPFGIFSFCSCNFSLRLRVLNAKMQRTKQGDISFCQRLEILPATSERHPPSANNEIALPKEFALEEGVILNSYYQIWFATRVRPYFIKEGACFQLATRHSFFSARLTWLSDALNNRCRPPFLADGDWVIAARRHGYDDLQALYNVSDGSVYLKNSPFHPGNQQMASIYKIAYGLVLIVMFFTLTIKLHDPMLNLGSWPFYREMLTRLTGTLLPINLLLIVMEFVCMIAHPLSRRVAGRVKVHQAILRYARRQGARMTPWELK
ncbi:TPA: hypothetical protein N2O48_003950 [Klebsiella pneumoniae]|nr:hypothetical protein [Klebsiella pneumoniae]